MPAPFLDSNILVYAVSDDPRSEIARKLIEQHFVISVQCLNEFASVARRKLVMPWDEVEEATGLFADLADSVHPLDLALHKSATGLACRYGYSFYDALIVAAALKAGAKILYSEDMHSGHELDEGLEIVNPFLAKP
jgi:predicted nucleic acid-binding protein